MLGRKIFLPLTGIMRNSGAAMEFAVALPRAVDRTEGHTKSLTIFFPFGDFFGCSCF
jgi:hypothetical protein